MPNAQIWLNQNYPLERRNEITTLLITNESKQESYQYYISDFDGVNLLPSSETLIGNLDLLGFVNLEVLVIDKQFLTGLNLFDCRKLRDIQVGDNLLKSITLPDADDRLEVIDLHNNNLDAQDLSVFARLVNLKQLLLGVDDRIRINQNLYNRFYGSLEHLQNLNELQELDINATDIDSGLEHLPVDELFTFTCGTAGRNGARVDEIKSSLGWDEDTAISVDMDDSQSKMRNIDDWRERFLNQLETQVEINRS